MLLVVVPHVEERDAVLVHLDGPGVQPGPGERKHLVAVPADGHRLGHPGDRAEAANDVAPVGQVHRRSARPGVRQREGRMPLEVRNRSRGKRTLGEPPVDRLPDDDTSTLDPKAEGLDRGKVRGPVRIPVDGVNALERPLVTEHRADHVTREIWRCRMTPSVVKQRQNGKVSRPGGSDPSSRAHAAHLQELAAGVAGQLVEPLDRGRALEVGEALPGPGDHVALGESGAGRTAPRAPWGSRPTGRSAPRSPRRRRSRDAAMSRFSTSAGYTFSPPEMIMSFTRSWMYR